jgi:2-hydroxy-6-oxonona-2,4-dienedioate hydrolase
MPGKGEQERKKLMPDFWIDLLVSLTILLAIGILVVTSRYLREIKSARGRIDSLGSRVIETACGPIEYARVGEGDPVLVVHGALGGFDQGLFLAHNIGAPNSQIISVSRFGFLRSPVPPGAMLDTQADAFAALLDALEIPRAAVFAVSAGSTSAIALPRATQSVFRRSSYLDPMPQERLTWRCRRAF